MYIKKLANKSNLHLALTRLRTGNNPQYKRYYRDLLSNYSIAAEQNLADLSQRLKRGTYKASEPVRIYLPKPSGLQRTYTLLSIEDNIVYQCLAHVFAEELRGQREALGTETVFSNVLASHDSVFFLEDWKKCYNRLRFRIKELFHQDYRWVAYFDLAAYYDTISHDLLLKLISPRGGQSQFTDTVCGWLETWSSAKLKSNHSHGIPQGPIASSLLADCFMIPIDQHLGRVCKFVRYVDDIRLFGKSEGEVRSAAVELDSLCSERGIIPQAKKFRIFHATELPEILEDTPSMIEEHRDGDKSLTIKPNESLSRFRSCLSSRPLRIEIKSKAKFILYRAQPSLALRDLVLRLLPRHPEYLDAFLFYLRKHQYSAPMTDKCYQILSTSPYDYVRGELLSFLADVLPDYRLFELKDVCLAILMKRKSGMASKFGACRILFRIEQTTGNRLGNWAKYLDEPLLQSLLVPYLPTRCLFDSSFISGWLKRTTAEPGIMLATPFARKEISPRQHGIHTNQLPRPVINIFRILGLLSGITSQVDPLGELISERYAVPRWDGWRALLGTEYNHACGLLVLADVRYTSQRSEWLSHLDLFNEVVVRRMLDLFTSKGISGAMATKVTGKPQLHPLGSFLDKNSPLSKAHPKIIEGFRLAHDRRSTLPPAHAYGLKTGARSRLLGKREQEQLYRKLSTSYGEIIKSAPHWGLIEKSTR